jgi:hypothetical protein
MGMHGGKQRVEKKNEWVQEAKPPASLTRISPHFPHLK